ncbi:MAG: radical SAM protein [Acidimicrobiia bacterium]|nr:radical SAM protein [Acidimicrobiia bacterium]
MTILLVSTYELGHQPLHLASPTAALQDAGHDVRSVDLSVEELTDGHLAGVDKVAISVPMHTAMRLALDVARRVRDVGRSIPVAVYGLYAGVGSDEHVGGLIDRAIEGAYLGELVEWAADGGVGLTRSLARERHPIPVRAELPGLDAYARLRVDGEERLAGYLEASHGCRHRCKHCPLPVVYDGRLRVVAPEVVAADAAQQVALGARHLTFGDPDFLNAPPHAIKTLEAVRAAAGEDLTFDVTVKVSHVLDHRSIWPRLAELGVTFVVSAFEQADDRLLALLDKGHTVADMREAVAILSDAGIAVRPTWLPFTPWTEGSHIEQIVRFIDETGLWGSVDPIQMSIRLLIPDGSLMLGVPELTPHLTGYDATSLGHRWAPEDPGMDALQSKLADLVEHADAEGAPDAVALQRLVTVISDHLGVDLPEVGDPTAAPRLTESWFCCAEPAARQLTAATGTSDCAC